jgi:CHC2 zinc finger/Toprim-like
MRRVVIDSRRPPQALVDTAQVRARLDLVEVMGRLTERPVRLHGNSASSACPNPSHEQTGKTPPCSINLTTGLWCCHSCGAGGDVITAIGIASHHDTKSAIQAAAALAGMPIESWPLPPAPKRIVCEQRGPSGVQTRLANAVQLRAEYATKRRWNPTVLEALGVQVVAVDSVPRIGIPVNPADRASGAQGRVLVDGGRGPRWWTLRPIREPFGLFATHGEEVVIVCEGASDYVAAACLRTANPLFPVTISAPGASSWRRGWAEPLTGKTVIVIGDNDDAGRRYVSAVAADCETFGVDVCTATWPGDDDLCAYLQHSTGTAAETAQKVIDHLHANVADYSESLAAA